MEDGYKQIKSPLGKARGLGSAKSGYHHWWIQRVTAIALVPLSLWMLVNIRFLFESPYFQAREWLNVPMNAVAVLLFVWMSFYHAILGLETIIEDYIHTKMRKTFWLLLVRFVFGLAGVMAGYAVLQVNFG